MHRILLAVLLSTGPASADVDMFHRLSGIYGDLHPVGAACTGAVQHVNFQNGNQRGALQIFSDNIEPGTVMVGDLGFVVLATTALGVQIQFDTETQTASNGAVVQWEFRPLTDPDSYCWHRTDWAADQCTYTVQRCDDPVPTS